MKWARKIKEMIRSKRSRKNVDGKMDVIEETNIKPFPINFYFKALVIADGHGCLDSNDIPDCSVDACLLLGDLSPREIEIIKKRMKGTPIYGVLGNHDVFDLYDRCGVENIHGKVVEVNGIRLAGIQGSLRYKDSDMPLYTDKESVEIAEKMNAANILISHDSPKHFHCNESLAHSGLQGITRYCEKHSVPLNIHGHFHENAIGALGNGTNVICCYGAQIVEITPSGISINR